MKSNPFLAKAISLIIPSLAFASEGNNYKIAKTFNFKEDIYLKICPLSNAVGPDTVGILMSALDSFGDQFKETWRVEIETNLQNGACTVDSIPLPEFSICDWRYPDRYDVDDLPTSGQSYVHEGCFVQRIYFKFSGLTIACPNDFSYDDIDIDSITKNTFADSGFVSILNPSTQCTSESNECFFSTVETVETVESGSDYAELSFIRFVDVPVYLKCLDLDGYGTSTANRLISALDKYFELHVAASLTKEILTLVPQGHVYGYTSPYKSERKYCAHGAYYAGGNLVNQVKDSDGILVTKFTYGFDLIWFKPQDYDQELLLDIESIINKIFDSEDFLLFLLDQFPEFDLVQNNEMCNVVDPKNIQVTLAPTEPPSPRPTSLLENGGQCGSDSQCVSGFCYQDTGVCTCNIDTNVGCMGASQVCRYSCAFKSKEPRCFDDEYKRDCESYWGEGYTCADGNNDGIVNVLDKNSGCSYIPPPGLPQDLTTPSPTLPPVSLNSLSPTNQSSLYPTPAPIYENINGGGPAGNTTFSPTTEVNSPSPSFPTAGTETSLLPTVQIRSENPSSLPKLPTLSPTYGNTEELGTSFTLSPTRGSVDALPPTMPPSIYIQPAVTEAPFVTLEPTPAPTDLTVNDCTVCIIKYPQDTEQDECPLVTTGTCGGGNRGDGICPFAGYCCSEWGYCGTTPEYCSSTSSNVPTPSAIEGAPVSPTYSVEAGLCGNGVQGEGLCVERSDCCSGWGYCGQGENYCFTTRTVQEDVADTVEVVGTCGGGGIGNGICNDGLCCSRFGFCGEGAEYCTGVNDVTATDAMVNDTVATVADVIPTPVDLPDNLAPEFGFRCGITEVDARSNCKPKCTHHIQCNAGEECWGIQLNYCNTFEEGSHPVCPNLDIADNDSRCGYDEMCARGYCGKKCGSDLECDSGEFCYPTLLNLCECHETFEPEESKIAFAKSKALLAPYFVERNPTSMVEGKARNGSFGSNISILVVTIVVGSVLASIL